MLASIGVTEILMNGSSGSVALLLREGWMAPSLADDG